MQNGFLNLYPSLLEAKQASYNPDGSTCNRYDYVKLSPDEFYLQTTNSAVDINFGGNYKAELIKCDGTVLIDVTANVYIYQFINSQTGIENVDFEMLYLPSYYGMEVYLKITQTTLLTNIFYSNAFCISPDSTGTSRIDFKGDTPVFGYDFARGFMYSIRVQGKFQQPREAGSGANYDQANGNRIAQGYTRILGWSHLIEYISNAGVIALSAFKQIPIKFVNFRKASSIEYSAEDIPGDANFAKGNMIAFYDLNSKLYTPVFQIAPNITLTSFAPVGLYTLAGLPTDIIGRFNVPITLGTGTMQLFSTTTGLLATYTAADVTIVGTNGFAIPLAGVVTTTGSYYLVTDGLFIGLFNQVYTQLDVMELTFDVQLPDWLAGDWLTGDWFGS